VRLASSATGSLEWLLGAFYTHEKSQRDLAFALYDVALNPLPNNLYNLSAPSVYDEYAGFADLTYHFNEKFDITGGVRYARNHQSYTQNASGLFIASLPTHTSNEGVTTYLANARYHFTDNATGYLRYATGYRPGGPNLVPRDPSTGLPIAPETFGADRLKSYEGGFKAEWLDRRFGVDVSVFHINWENIQILATRNNFGFNANAPSGAVVNGTELALSGRPVQAFTIAAAFAYEDAHMAGGDPDLGAADGETLPGVPRFTATLDTDYVLGGSRYHPTLGATYRFVSKRTSSFDASTGLPQYHLPAYRTVDLRAGLTLSSTLHAQFYARNIFNERGQVSAFTQFGTPRVAITPPRTVGFTITTHF
jgi:outer membrane receptor protein involved in Fe transport